MSNQSPYPISIAFTVENIKKSIKFYRDKLGFELSGCWPDAKKPVWANLVLNGQSVMLGQVASPKDTKKQFADDKKAAEYWSGSVRDFQRSKHGVGVRVFLSVDDVDRFVKDAKKERVKTDLPPKTEFYGMRRSVITDPDGYALVFYTHVHEEPSGAAGEDAECADAVAPIEMDLGD